MRAFERFEDASINFNMGNFFSRSVRMKGCILLVNDELADDPYLNYATRIRAGKNARKLIRTVEAFFIARGSRPAFYLTPSTQPGSFRKTLVSLGYVPFCSDAWMFFDLKKSPMPDKKISVRKITKKELKEFKRVFNEVYTKGEEGDPYAGLSPLYGKFLVKRFSNRQAEHYAAFLGRKMVGTIVIVHDNKDACLYALAVLPEFRKMGVCRSLIASCVARAKELEMQNLYLQTEKNSRNEMIFKKLGFITKFVADGFVRA
jgi:ribosomal protein S18 acetylase RimI-like enzyme